jgi:hypothetical protein
MSEESEHFIRSHFEQNDAKIQTSAIKLFEVVTHIANQASQQINALNFHDITHLLSLLRRHPEDLLHIPDLLTSFVQGGPVDIEQVAHDMGLPSVPRTRLH